MCTHSRLCLINFGIIPARPFLPVFPEVGELVGGEGGEEGGGGEFGEAGEEDAGVGVKGKLVVEGR